MKKFSVIIPFYNGLETIEELVSRIIAVGIVAGFKFDIIIVDDSGSAESNLKLQEVFKGYELVSVIPLSRNFGQHVATFIGILKASNNPVITMDEDLKFAPEDVPKLVNVLNDNDMVYGVVARKAGAETFRDLVLGVIKPMLSNRYPAKTSSFRIISKDIVLGIKNVLPRYIQIEGMLIQKSRRYDYVNVENGTDSNRKSSYNVFSLYLMISGLLTHYTLVPWLVISVVVLAISPYAVCNFQPFELALISGLSTLALFNIYGEVKNIVLNYDTKKELARLGLN